MDLAEQQLLQDILLELKKLNNSRTNYAKSFLAGLLHSLGSFLGTAVFAVFMVYLFGLFSSRLIRPTSHFIENVFKQIDWTTVIPAPKVDLNLKNIDLGL